MLDDTGYAGRARSNCAMSTSYAQGSTDVPQPGPSTVNYTSDEPPRTAKVVLIGSASVGERQTHVQLR